MKNKINLLVFILSLLFLHIANAQTITATHTYDALHRLSSTTYSNGVVISYAYDALGNRTSKTISGVSCPQPVASFGASPNALSVTFTNTSSNATSYLWDFGDGQTSTLQSPNHTYSAAGTYNACLTATNGCGSNMSCSSVQLNNQVACWSKISSGTYHTLAIKTDGTLWAWGTNGNGQLGDGTIIDKNSPTQIGNDNNWKEISAGSNHSMAIKNNGTLWGWGNNGNGQLGDGTIIQKIIPTQIGTSVDWQKINTGYAHTLGIRNNNSLWAWGSNTNGQLGDGTIVNKLTPVQIGFDLDWQMISLGFKHSIAIKSNGSLWSWGLNSDGQLGDGTLIDKQQPTQVGVSNAWAKIESGLYHVLALKSDSSLWAWGWNSNSQLGDSTIISKSSPIQIGTNKWIEINANMYHNVAIRSNGTLWGWGKNDVGQLLGTNTADKMKPQQLSSLTNWRVVSTGNNFSSSIKLDNSLWVWGGNSYGQLGDSTFVNKSATLKIASLGCGCYMTLSRTITQPSCVPGADGTVSLVGGSGIQPYSYSMQPITVINQNTGFATNLSSGVTYTFTVTDALGCQKATSFVTFPQNITIGVSTVPQSASVCLNDTVTFTAYEWQTNIGISNYSWTGGISNGVPFSAQNSGTYSVTATANNGCVATASVPLTIIPTPNLSISVSPNDSICYGSSVTLIASGASTYSWSGGISNGISFAPLSTSTYTVTGTDNVSNCTATASQLITVNSCGTCLPDITISTSPFITALTESQTWIKTSGTVLIPLGANVKFDANATSYVQLNPGFRADYGSKFLAQAYNGCTAGSPQKTDSIGTEHTNQTFDQRNLILYPNPTSGKVTLMHPKEVKEIQVFDMVGKRLLRVQTHDHEMTELDLSEFPNGIYHVRTEGFTTIKVIKH